MAALKLNITNIPVQILAQKFHILHFFLAFLSTFKEMFEQCLKLGSDHFLSHTFNYVFPIHPIILLYMVWANGKTLKKFLKFWLTKAENTFNDISSLEMDAVNP